MLRHWTVLLVFGLLLCAQGIEATQVVRRWVLAVGANDGGRKNFSGPELSFSLSLLWGKDVETVKSIRR